ncbi:hypothetical protein K438DRAFT_1486669, partial [Mycena galopus ATCC 62051]
LTTTSASFFAASIGSFVYGLFFILALLSNGLHIQRIIQNYKNISRRALMSCVLRNRMIMAGFTMFLVVTARWVLDVVNTAYGLLESNDPEVYFQAPFSTPAVIGVGFLVASLLVCDTILVYRLWIVWNKSTAVVIFPCLSLLGMLASGIGVTHQMAVITPGESPFSEQPSRWIVSDMVSNLLFVNFLSISIQFCSFEARRYLSASNLVMTFSSGSAWIVFGMVTYATKSPLDRFVRATLGTVSGISFMLINVRVALGW